MNEIFLIEGIPYFEGRRLPVTDWEVSAAGDFVFTASKYRVTQNPVPKVGRTYTASMLARWRRYLVPGTILLDSEGTAVQVQAIEGPSDPVFMVMGSAYSVKRLPDGTEYRCVFVPEEEEES